MPLGINFRFNDYSKRPQLLRRIKWSFLFQFLFCSIAFSAGFQSQEQSTAVLGAANAGTAVTRDPSIVFFNPAGMTEFQHPAVSVSGIWVQPSFDFQTLIATDFVGNPITGTENNPGVGTLIPAAFYVQPINEKWFFGLSFEVPFGLSTFYDDTSYARYFATRSKIAAYTLSPSAAYKINEQFSIGVGLDIQYLTASLDQAYDFASVSQFNNGDVFIDNDAHSWGAGWNVGIYVKPTPSSRFGIAYRSHVNHSLNGSSDVSNVPDDVVSTSIAEIFGLRDSDVSSQVELPESLVFSFAYDVTPRWTTLVDVQYMHWSSVQSITLTFSGNPTGLNPATNHLPPATLLLDYQDSVRVALGEEVKVNKDIVMRFGFAFDQTPSRGQAQLVRLPDGNRYWLTLGSSFHVTKNWTIDIAYAHIFFEDRTVTQSFNTGLGGPTEFSAKYENSEADLGGLQLTYQFG